MKITKLYRIPWELGMGLKFQGEWEWTMDFHQMPISGHGSKHPESETVRMGHQQWCDKFKWYKNSKKKKTHQKNPQDKPTKQSHTVK